MSNVFLNYQTFTAILKSIQLKVYDGMIENINWMWRRIISFLDQAFILTILLIGLSTLTAYSYISSFFAAVLITLVYKYKVLVTYDLHLNPEYEDFKKGNRFWHWMTFEFAGIYSGIFFRNQSYVTLMKIKWGKDIIITKPAWRDVFAPENYFKFN